MSGTHLAISYGNTSEITLRKILHLWRFFLKRRYNINMDSKKLSIRLLILVFIIFVLNYFAMEFYWYSSIWYSDIIMHFLGGLWLGLFSIYLFSIKDSSFKSILKIFFVVLLIGISWEIFEILIDKFITQNSFNFLDTMSDIFFDVLGGLLAVWYFIKQIMVQSKDGPWGNSLKDRP